ncbi:MAG: efflux RND transporter periplasmic adaptor subunit [Betaproteobacteria bacterium]
MIAFSVHKCSVLMLGFAFAIALSACGKRDESQAKPVAEVHNSTHDEHAGEQRLTLSTAERATAGIRTAELTSQSFVDQVVLTATIRANQDRIAHVAPRVSARITEVKARLGDTVKKGQTLALLDSIELGEAHSAYQQAQSQFSLATSDFERAQKLKAEDIIPEKDYLRARSEYEKAKASLRAADDKLRLLDVAHRDAEKGTGSVFPLRSPFAGTVIEKDAVLGELARPDKSIFTIADLSTLWIEADLFEKDLHRVRTGAAATVTVSAYPDETFKGRLTYISSTVDKETRALVARVEVPNPGGRLKPEMFATASIDTASTNQALTLPQDAVLLINGQAMAFVQEGDGFEARALDLGDKFGGRVVVRGGIKEGEQVVIAGAYALKARMLKSQIGDTH